MSTIEEGVTHNMQNVQQTPQPGSTGTTGVQNTQNNHNTQNITINNNRPQSYPDETGYTMPPDTGAPVNGTWVYGSPDLSYDGKSPSNGVSVYTMDGSTPPGNPDSVPMPIPGMNGETHMGTGISRAAAQSERMKNPVSMADTHLPPDSETAYQASLRSLLDRNVGYFIVASFLIGTQQTVTWQGILHSVGSDYLVLYQPDYERYISCDIYSLKFVQFHNVKGVPYCAASQNWQGHSSF